MTLLHADPRWLRLHDATTPCACCGQRFSGLPALAAAAPDAWGGQGGTEANEEVLSGRRPLLTDDFCLVKDGQFIRCTLELPLLGGDGDALAFGVWASLSQANFDLYVETMDGGAQGGLGPWFGWFSSSLPAYPGARGLKCHVRPQDGGVRPLIELEPTDHPLAKEQREGISLDRALEVLAICGWDLRSHLMAR